MASKAFSLTNTTKIVNSTESGQSRELYENGPKSFSVLIKSESSLAADKFTTEILFTQAVHPILTRLKVVVSIRYKSHEMMKTQTYLWRKKNTARRGLVTLHSRGPIQNYRTYCYSGAAVHQMWYLLKLKWSPTSLKFSTPKSTRKSIQ